MMALDSQQSQFPEQCAELSTSENGELYSSDYPYLENNQPSFLEAKTVYLSMQANVPVSRACRLQWLLDNLNTIIAPSQEVINSSSNLEIISVIPREQNVTLCNRYLVTDRTEVKFIAYNYRIVYCLDMSPSQANVDIQKGEILFDEILNCFRASLHGLCHEFKIPGSSQVFSPCICLTVIVNTPFFLSPAQQVLVKGVEVSLNNIDEIVRDVEKQFHLLEGKIADVSAQAIAEMDSQKALDEELGFIYDLPEKGKIYSRVPMVTPDVNFVNMLRYSMLAISLLPENSLSHILVITDGIVAMPDSNIMETLLFQLHYDSIAISFLKVGSSFHPHSSAGFVSYTDILYFFAHSTLGTCLENFVHIKPEPSMSLNIYHELFLLWSFHSGNKYACFKLCDNNIWTSANNSFSNNKLSTLLSKRQTDEITSASFQLLISRRLREGFTVDNVFFINGSLELTLVLLWKSSVYIHYKLKVEWPLTKAQTQYELCILVLAPYEFLHDVTCPVTKETRTAYRQAIIDRFWLRLTQLSSGDHGLAQQLSSLQTNKDWHTLPESVRNGIPAFILHSSGCSDNAKLMLTPSDDTSSLKFISMWQAICQIETNNWRKWFHTHKLSLILRHDFPVPIHLHVANASQRFQIVQCRQAATSLYGFLAEWASFILIDNHTYLKLLYKEQPEKPPTWFCILRFSSKFPCVVLNIGFCNGTPGQLRLEVCDNLKKEISSLCYLSSATKVRESLCCMLLQKPLEKILIRYERIPNIYTTVIFPDGTQPPDMTQNLPSTLTGSLFTTLSRYLYHKRWIYSATLPCTPKLPHQSVSGILSTLTRMRLREGYSFAHSASGIITMVIELMMEPNATCVVQYVLFPPHSACLADDIYSGSEEDNDQSSDNDIELQIVTEVWIEPQYGRVIPNNPRMSYVDNKRYYEIANAISLVDFNCINSLLTMEHLSLLSHDRTEERFNLSESFGNFNHSTSSRKTFSRRNSRNSHVDSPSVPDPRIPWYPIISPRIEHIPFKFDPIAILPLCHQTEQLFSMFIETNEKKFLIENNIDKANSMLLENILEHLGFLHDRELELDKDDSDRFTQEIINRHRNRFPHMCPISANVTSKSNSQDGKVEGQWRCFLKGVSRTHVILTFIASTLDDLKTLMVDHTHIPSLNESMESADRASSTCSNYSDVPINTSTSMCLPIYVFDCPLGRIENAYISSIENNTFVNEDVYEDHTFKHGETITHEYIRSRSQETSDNKDDNDMGYNVKHHCKTLILTHSKCFTISLFIALHQDISIHNYDVQSAIDQCEESVIEIDITEYMLTICAHAKQTQNGLIPIKHLNGAYPCCELKQLHALIKEEFCKLIGTIFYPIRTHSEYYYYKNLKNLEQQSDDNLIDSDDEMSESRSECVEFKSDKDGSIYSEKPFVLQRMVSGISAMSDITSSEVDPLFLHLICTLRYGNGEHSNTPMRDIPTCLGELIQNLEANIDYLEKSNIQVTLDIMCLTLPSDVQNIIADYSTYGVRTTSFCSDVMPPSITSTTSDASFNAEFRAVEPLKHLSESQRKSVLSIQDEIKWLLRDEICTALLDIDEVDIETLQYVIKHVTDSSTIRQSCILDIVDLNFVFSIAESHEKFTEQFTNMTLPVSGYKLCRKDEYYYLAKDPGDFAGMMDELSKSDSNLLSFTSQSENEIREMFRFEYNRSGELIIPGLSSQPSEISSVVESAADTDGYDEDVSEDYEDFEWLQTLNNKHPILPNFWLIMKIQPDVVAIYFHCRFVELPSSQVHFYLEIQRALCEAVKDLCKRVNQLLLLQSLCDTKKCDPLLEQDDTMDCNSPISRHSSFVRLKSLEVQEYVEDYDYMTCSASLSEASLNFRPGYFSCPVVWEYPFILHPRLKTGPGKSGIISRGIMALKHVLDKFSVSNRNNMFVYKDKQQNVFYLRLHECVQNSGTKLSILRSSEFESGTVSRSPSIASLPLGQNKSNLTLSEQSISSVTSIDIRPRVRSFGEKESKDTPNEDTLILKVHGVNSPGTDVRSELVEVLQNRLDDAVLDCLSIMLARNAMCPLTPEDVHFIQKPFRPPEFVIRVTIQDFALQWIQSFIYYLKQNLLEFLNVPKYTDSRLHYHFKDYVENDKANNTTNHLVSEDNIFIYNQGQNPSSGSRGIACIALALISARNCNDKNVETCSFFEKIFENNEYDVATASDIISDTDDLPQTYVEFRLWKQGRVNIENLSHRLRNVVSQASWDIVTEYYLLKESLCLEMSNTSFPEKSEPVKLSSMDNDFSKEVEFNCSLDINTERNIRPKLYKEKVPKYEQYSHRKKRNRQIIPHTSKSSRSIGFDEMAKEKERSEKANVKVNPNLTTLETGDSGRLSPIYSKYLPNWLDFGVTLNTPSIKRQRINIPNRHLPHVIIAELMGMLLDSPKAFRCITTNCTKDEESDLFVPYVSTNLITKCLIISRNQEYWHTTININQQNPEMPDMMRPPALKHSQKFVPTISNNCFIPRQKILWLAVENDNIIIYTYNWTKDNVDKFFSHCTNLGCWLCVRSSFLNSITSQKLGLFHNQQLTRKIFMIQNNPYANLIGSIECMISFPKEHSQKRIPPAFNFNAIVDAFRDNFRICKFASKDPVGTFIIEIREMKTLEKKNREEMKTLHGMYQSRTSTVTVQQTFMLMQNSRIVHYCHTPLLFLPRWRLKTASTRDHSLYPSQAIQMADKMASEEKELWHTELCYCFFLEYRQYLQTLGFIPLQIDNPKNVNGLWTRDKSSYNSVFYIQKTILGGILIFTVEFVEPFFVTKLYAIECNRLQNIPSRASINRFTLSFLDECDRVKILMHLHSFTYDFHLRCIYNYISCNQNTNKVCDRYNVHQFLDDFMKYYNKAPNFARNLVHTDTITIKDLVTEGKQLFDYLLLNVSQYDFKFMEMDLWEGETEYILVQVTTTPQMSYKDSQDRQQTDDFDITLVVYNICTPYSPSDYVLHLKYYLILTSKREMYPKSEIDEKLGKFRTVSSTARSLSALEREPNSSELMDSTVLDDGALTNSDETQASCSRKHSSASLNGDGSVTSQHSNSLPYVELSTEFVNYLGYYSSHEQLMQQLILDKANETQKNIKSMVSKGMIDCRTHLLWNRLILPQDKSLSFEEFLELKRLAKLEHLCQRHTNLGPLLNQPLCWYQGLAKLLLVKYADHNRVFISPDGNIQHYVILDPKYFGAFMLLSLDLQHNTERGELYAVFRELQKQEDADLCLAYQKSLLDGFVNCICFYLWSGMISN